MVYGLVYDSQGGASATPPPRDTVHKPGPRFGFDNRQVDGFDYAGG